MKSLEELKAIRDRMQGQVGIRGEEENVTRVVVGMATCGIAAGARPVLTAFSDAVQEKGLKNVMVTQTGCIGLCQYEPIVELWFPARTRLPMYTWTPKRPWRLWNGIWRAALLLTNTPYRNKGGTIDVSFTRFGMRGHGMYLVGQPKDY